MNTPARLSVTGATAVLVLALSACGGSDGSGSMSGMDHGGASSSSSASSSESSPSASAAVDAVHNAADTSFAQNMIVHHRGALAMAEMATTRAATPAVEDLAARISAAQGPEIEQMTSWLHAWGEPVPAEAMGGMHHGSTDGSMGESMPGMMTQEQMDQLMAASGTDFDRMWLQMMTAHHRGAVQMAQAEQAEGSNPRAIALAEAIEGDQTTEIAEMDQVLQASGS